MSTNHQIVSFPLYFWENYNSFISDKELQVLGHMLGSTLTGKKSWEMIAFKMGYKSVKSIDTMMNKLVERQLIMRKAYVIDWTPLYDSCLALSEDRELKLAPTKEKKEKKESSPYYGLAAELKKEFGGVNIPQVANQMDTFHNNYPEFLPEQISMCFTLGYRHSNLVSANLNSFIYGIKPFIGANIQEDDLLAFLTYLTSYQNIGKGLSVAPYLNVFTIGNYNIWVEKDRPSKFVKKKQTKEKITFD